MNRPSVQGSAAITAASSTTMIGRRNVLLKNSGAKTVFIRLNDGEAVVTDFPLVTTGERELRAGDNSVIYSISAICGGADASTLDYLAFD